MTFLIISLIFFVIWMSLVVYAKQEARSLLNKYGTPLSWLSFNSVVSMLHKLKELNNRGVFDKDDAVECKFITLILKSIFIMLPVFMILTLVIPLIFNRL